MNLQSRHVACLWICLAVIGMTISAGASYKIRIPHSIEWRCEEGDPPNGGYWGVAIVWGDYPGAESFTIISHHGAFGGGSVGGDVHEWGILGGSPMPPGKCPEQEANVNPPWYQHIYEVWATFPEGGNLQLTKTDNAYGAVHPGDEIRYFLIYKNTGKYPLMDAVVQETWPAYMEYLAGGNPKGTNSVTWDFGTLNPGSWRQVELVLRVSENIPRHITEIYNVAVVHPAPSPSPTPTAHSSTTTSPVTGIALSHCDALRCNVTYGDVEWIDKPLSSSWADLYPYDVVRGADSVRVDEGYTSFNHTVATGTLLLLEGGLTLTDCPDLDDNVLSEITLEIPGSIEHSVSGILSGDEFVRVVGADLVMEIHNGRYTYIGDSGLEAVEIESGRVTVIDPDGTRHDLSAGTTYTWPPEDDKMPQPDNGPTLVATEPDDFCSVENIDITITTCSMNR